MTAIHETAYPRLRNDSTEKLLTELFTPKEEEISFASCRTRQPLALMSILVQLKAFQYLGCFVPFNQISKPIINHVAQLLNEFMGITPFDIKSKNYLKGLALQAAQTKNHLSDIINVLLEELVRLKIELPAFSLLRRIAQKARQQINENCYQEVYPFLNKEMMNRLEKLLDKEDKMTSGWDNLKQDAKKPTSHHIKEFVDYLRELQAWRHLLPPY